MSFRFAIAGGGIAGMSIAARLAARGHRVVVLEMEDGLAFHATGRSAALHDPTYVPTDDVGALARASARELGALPGVLTPKAVLHLYGEDHAADFAAAAVACRQGGIPAIEMDADGVEAIYPFLRRSEQLCAAGLLIPPGAANAIDVHALIGAAWAKVRAGNGVVMSDEPLESATRQGGGWTIHTKTTTVRADVVVNAAGAWADIVAARCGVRPLGVVPLLRTVVETALEPSALAPSTMSRTLAGPFVFWGGADEDLYCDLKSGGRVLISLADEQVSQPCDAQPDDLDVATAVDRFGQRTHLRVSGRRHSRAGLRTFAGDRNPVIGWSADEPGFFWSAAYGGFGIECSPAASAVACDLLLGERRFSAEAMGHGLYPARFAPDRLEPAPLPR